ncbi:MAG: GNAT family N-acetyltransferase [bacterium]|nr:GNAT family N-acetyltransferase [bacterium]
MEQINYKKATILDLEILTEWRIKFLKYFFNNSNEEENKNLEIEILKYLKIALPNNQYIAWLAEVDNKIVGIGAMAVYYAPPKYYVPNGKIGYILNIYTLKRARRKGIATFILDKLIKEAKENEIYYLHLHASQDVAKIYKNVGFQSTEGEYCLELK